MIAAMVGLDTRATMDMDATIKGMPVNEQTVQEIFHEICKIELRDDVTFHLYILAKLQYTNVQPDILKRALNATTEKRGSSAVVKEYRKIMNMVRNSEEMQKQWNYYQKDFEYAADVSYEDVCDAVEELMDVIGKVI